MVFLSFAAILLAAVSAAPVLAQPCDGAPVTSIDPHFEPGITGAVCHLDRGTAYVAGSALSLVDVNVWDQPFVTGSVQLPAAARDIAVTWPRAYVACGDAGVVEVDVRDAAAPVITRIYDPVGPVLEVVAVNGAIVALDSASDLHLLAAANDGPLVAAAVRQWPGACNLAEARGYLVVEDWSRLSIVRSFSSSGFDVTGVVAHDIYPHYSALAASGDKVVHLTVYLLDGDYASGAVDYIFSYQVTPQGALSRLSSRGNISGDSQGVVVAGAGGWFLQTSDNPSVNDYPAEVNLRRAGDLSNQATLPFGGTSISMDGHVIVAVGHAGLATMPLEPALRRPKPRDVVGNGEVDLGPGFNTTTRGARWCGRFGLLTSTVTSSSGGAYGGVRITRDYSLVCGDDPDTWAEITSGRVSQHTPRGEYNTYGSADLRLVGSKGDRATLVLAGCQTLGITVVDGQEGRIVHRYDQPAADYCGLRNGYADGLLWYTDGVTVHCLDTEAALPLAPVDVTAAIAPGDFLPADRNLLVVRNEVTGAYDAYDTSDLFAIRPLGSLVATPGFWALRTAWLGHRLVADCSTSLVVADFTDPAAPVIRSRVALPHRTTGMTVAGDRVVLRCDEELYVPIRLSCRFQVADLAADGAVTLHAPWSAGPTTDRVTTPGCVLAGSVLYADLGYAVRAYDLADPEHPAALGDTRNGSGSPSIFGGFLASGSFLTPRHCRDLAPTRTIAIDVLRLLKPAAGSAYTGPAMALVAVPPSPGFDPAQLDPASVRFGPGGATPVPAPLGVAARAATAQPTDGEVPAPAAATFWFRLDEARLTSATTEARLTGRTFAGENVLGISRLSAPPPGPGLDDVPALAASPNPFNPQTTLSYTLENAGPCSLAIYNLQGQCVRSLVQETRASSGRHSATWDGRDDHGSAVASGVYIVRLVHQGGIRTQRLALVR